MHWIIQSNVCSEEGWNKLIGALDHLKCSYSIHKCIPFSGGLDPEPAPPPGPVVVVMGSYTLALEAQRRGWTPGAFLNGNFDYAVQLTHWGSHMLNSVNVRVDFIRDVPKQEKPFFIRPVDDSKSFIGQVMDWGQFSEWRDKLGKLVPEDGATVDLRTPVLFGPTYRILGEWRVWIVDKEVVTASLYKYLGRPQVSPFVSTDVLLYAQRRAMEWRPARAYCLDVFQTADEVLHIGEINNLNSSGFYEGDMVRLVAAIERMVF